MSDPEMPRVATIASWLGKFAPSCALAGLVGIHLGVIPPLGGFLFLQLGLLVALFSIGFGLAGLFVMRGRAEGPGRTASWLGLASGSLMLAITLIAVGPGIGDFPPINDITTDLEDPPAFASATDVPDYAGRDMTYPPEFVEVVRTSYSDLAPIRISEDPASVYARAVEIAESLGWEVVHRDPAAGTFDARETSRVFKFVDDITIRIRSNGGVTVVDVRSKSRDGRGDLGANATRIRAFIEALKQAG